MMKTNSIKHTPPKKKKFQAIEILKLINDFQSVKRETLFCKSVSAHKDTSMVLLDVFFHELTHIFFSE